MGTKDPVLQEFEDTLTTLGRIYENDKKLKSKIQEKKSFIEEKKILLEEAVKQKIVRLSERICVFQPFFLELLKEITTLDDGFKEINVREYSNFFSDSIKILNYFDPKIDNKIFKKKYDSFEKRKQIGFGLRLEKENFLVKDYIENFSIQINSDIYFKEIYNIEMFNWMRPRFSLKNDDLILDDSHHVDSAICCEVARCKNYNDLISKLNNYKIIDSDLKMNYSIKNYLFLLNDFGEALVLLKKHLFNSNKELYKKYELQTKNIDNILGELEKISVLE